jgi:hypothetical protein
MAKQSYQNPFPQFSSDPSQYYPGHSNPTQITFTGPNTNTQSLPYKPTQHVTHPSGIPKPVSVTPPLSNSLSGSSIASYALKPTEGYARKTVEQLQRELVEQRMNEMNSTPQANIARQPVLLNSPVEQIFNQGSTYPSSSRPLPVSFLQKQPHSPLDPSAFHFADKSLNHLFHTGNITSSHSCCSHDSFKSLSNSEHDDEPANNLRFDAICNDISFWK